MKRCHFEARYSYGPPAQFTAESIGPHALERMMEASKTKTYIHDICTACGKIVAVDSRGAR